MNKINNKIAFGSQTSQVRSFVLAQQPDTVSFSGKNKKDKADKSKKEEKPEEEKVSEEEIKKAAEEKLEQEKKAKKEEAERKEAERKEKQEERRKKVDDAVDDFNKGTQSAQRAISDTSKGVVNLGKEAAGSTVAIGAAFMFVKKPFIKAYTWFLTNCFNISMDNLDRNAINELKNTLQTSAKNYGSEGTEQAWKAGKTQLLDYINDSGKKLNTLGKVVTIGVPLAIIALIAGPKISDAIKKNKIRKELEAKKAEEAKAKAEEEAKAKEEEKAKEKEKAEKEKAEKEEKVKESKSKDTKKETEEDSDSED